MRISDWSSDVCSSDLAVGLHCLVLALERLHLGGQHLQPAVLAVDRLQLIFGGLEAVLRERHPLLLREIAVHQVLGRNGDLARAVVGELVARSEEHTSELQSLMRSSYAVFCLKKQNNN